MHNFDVTGRFTAKKKLWFCYNLYQFVNVVQNNISFVKIPIIKPTYKH